MTDPILKLPLTANSDGEIYDARDHNIADCWLYDDTEDVRDARAAEIVRRVNLHDELVEALRKALPVLRGQCGDAVVPSIMTTIEAEKAVAAALAKVEAR